MLSSDAVLITMLRETTRLLDLGSDRPLRALLPQRDRDWLVDNGVEILAPLMHHDGTIGAILTFGRKRCGCPFVRRDHWLMRTLITAAAAAWDADAADITAAEPARARPRPSEALGEVAFECPQCGVVVRSEALPCGCGAEAVLASLPQHLGEKFVVQRRVGVGGMGVVYLARDTTLDRDVVLKTLPALRPDAGAHLRNEARAMAALNHDSVATIYGLERWRRTPVLVVEYFPNGTLARRLADGPLSPADAVRLGIKLARALAYIHARGVLHRDLKPSNIAFSATGVPKLLDFGLVTLIRPTTAGRGSLAGADDACGRLAGTSGYLPPEAYRGAPPTPAFDLWALSVVLIEAITGVNPFSVNHRGLTISGATAVDLTKIRSQQLSSSPPLRTFFERALARHPARRFQSGLEVQSALEALATWQGHSLDTSGVR